MKSPYTVHQSFCHVDMGSLVGWHIEFAQAVAELHISSRYERSHQVLQGLITTNGLIREVSNELLQK